jgi:hypothetical protein
MSSKTFGENDIIDSFWDLKNGNQSMMLLYEVSVSPFAQSEREARYPKGGARVRLFSNFVF